MLYESRAKIHPIWAEAFDGPFGLRVVRAPLDPWSFATILENVIMALIPSIGALAGAALARSNREPTWGPSILSVLLSVLPVAIIDFWLLPATFGRHPHIVARMAEHAALLILALWIVAPVLMTRYLHKRVLN
jgi:hypothetical protein